MYFVYLVSSETCVSIYADFLKYVVFSNLMLIWVSYIVNDHRVVAVVLEVLSLKIGPNLSQKCIMFRYVRWRKSEKCVSSNDMHHHENPIELHGCSASSVLFRLGSIPFLET